MTANDGHSGEDVDHDHQAHGKCMGCGYPAHRYPFGWQHVGSGLFSCAALSPQATCCTAHSGAES